MCIDKIIYNETYELLKTFKIKTTTNRPNASGLHHLTI